MFGVVLWISQKYHFFRVHLYTKIAQSRFNIEGDSHNMREGAKTKTFASRAPIAATIPSSYFESWLWKYSWPFTFCIVYLFWYFVVVASFPSVRVHETYLGILLSRSETNCLTVATSPRLGFPAKSPQGLTLFKLLSLLGLGHQSIFIAGQSSSFSCSSMSSLSSSVSIIFLPVSSCSFEPDLAQKSFSQSSLSVSLSDTATWLSGLGQCPPLLIVVSCI